MLEIRAYTAADEPGWLECRLLSFFESSYFDDVKRSKTVLQPDSIELVAIDGDDIVGVIDVELLGDAATIDTIAVHPRAQRGGLATALLDAAIARLPETVRTLDAWTREDVAANAWYAKRFSIAYRYLHVYASDGEHAGFVTPDGLSLPIASFMHAPLEREAEMRSRFARVHECRQYVLTL